MISEVKTYRLSCDNCGKKMQIENITHSPRSEPLPEGWSTVEIWGKPAGYDKDFCPECADQAAICKKENEEARQKYWERKQVTK